MYESCENDTEGNLRRLSICWDSNDTEIMYPNEAPINIDSLPLTILFGVVCVAGLIGNLLVVASKNLINQSFIISQ